MNPFTILFWIVEHWWIFAIVAALALAVLLWTGVVQIAAVIVALAKIATAIVKFFATPSDQIAAKVLFGVIVFVIAGSLFYQIGKRDERAVWKKAEAVHALAMKRLEENSAAEAQKRVDEATTAERSNTEAAEQKANDYEKRLREAANSHACDIDDADLAAGGVHAPANRINKRRNPK